MRGGVVAFGLVLSGAATANILPPMCRLPAEMLEDARTMRRVLAGWDVCQAQAEPERREIEAALAMLLAHLDGLDPGRAAEERERLDAHYRTEHYEFRRRIAFEPDLCTRPVMRGAPPDYLRQMRAYRAEVTHRIAPGGAWASLQCDPGARR